MSLDYATFRQRFPAFADTTRYPDSLIEIFYDTAEVFIDSCDSPCRVLNGKQLALALEYMAAHLLFLANASQQDPEDPDGATGAAEDSGGFTISASIGDISVTKMTPPAADAWSWWLNSSPYGSALLALISALAVGGLSYGGLPEREGFRKIGGVFW